MTAVPFLEAMFIVLLVGDFGSTFFYHVPQHIWFTLHLRTHHDNRRSYWDHAILTKDPAVLLDGLLGVIPYLAVAACVWHISPFGALAGLAVGQLHVWWRHTTELGWATPAWLVRTCNTLNIVTPEDHNGHHRNPDIEFGDLFRFYDAPARAFLTYVRSLNRRRRTAMKRLQRIRALRSLRTTQ